MPAFQADVDLPAGAWTAISSGAVSTAIVSLQNLSTTTWIEVQATTANSAPSGGSASAGAVRIPPAPNGDEIEVARRFGGIGSSVYLWARPMVGAARVAVSHGA